MHILPKWRGLGARVSMSRLPRAMWTTLGLFALLSLAPDVAQAGALPCTLENTTKAPLEGPAGITVTYEFVVVDDGSGNCTPTSTVNGQVAKIGDSASPGSSATLQSGSINWSGALDDVIEINVDLGPNSGTASFQVTCPSCIGGPSLEFTTTSEPDITLTQVTPADGTVIFAGGEVDLVVELLIDGSPPPGAAEVQWEIVENPNGSSFGGPFKGATFAQGNIIGGSGFIPFEMGSFNSGTSTVRILATIYAGGPNERSVEFVLQGRDEITLEAIDPDSDNQEGFAGETLPVPFAVQLLRNGEVPNPPRGGAGLQGSETINWTVSPPGAVILSATSTPVDGAGQASVTGVVGNVPGPFTVTAVDADGFATPLQFNGTALQYTIEKPASGSGDGQSGPPNSTLPQPLRADVLVNGSPTVVPTGVLWTVISGSATLVGPNPTQGDAESPAEINVTLGAVEGPVVVRAELVSDSTVFTDYNLQVGSVRTLEKTSTDSGDGQSGAPGETLPLPLQVLARNDGTPAFGVDINWSVSSGAATLSAPSTQTGQDGVANVDVTLGQTPGTVVIVATRADDPASSQTFTLTATGSAVLALVKPTTGSGNLQEGLTGDTLPDPLVVIAQNNGSPVGDIVVTWQVTSGDASLSSAQTVTTDDGRTSVTVTFGQSAGDVQITATRSDAPTATSTFQLTARARITATYSIEKPENSGDGSSAEPGATVELVARTLSDNVATPFERVGWIIVSGDATARPNVTTSGSDGLARTDILLGSTPGPVTVSASLVDRSTSNSVLYTINNGSGSAPVLTAVSGDGQSAAPGSTLAPLVVRYANGTAPVSGSAVTWTLVDGSAVLGASSTITDSDGRSQIGVTLGSSAGPVRVRATAGDSSVLFELTATSAGISLRAVSGRNQSGPIGSAADLPLLVEVLDSAATPVDGQPLRWELLSGSATLNQAETITDASGRSSVTLTYGQSAGGIVVLAYLPGQRENGVRFELTAVQPGLRSITGNGQTGLPGQPLAQDFVVELVLPAAPAKALNGVGVVWQVLEGGGSLDTSTGSTDTAGRARARLTLGPAPGINRVSATVAGSEPVIFTATAQAGDNVLSVVSGSGQSLPTQTASAPLVVQLRSSSGQPVIGTRILWSSDNADLEPASSITGSDGRASTVARLILPGAATVTATVEGSDASATFALNGGIATIPNLDDAQEDIADAIDAFCPGLANASGLTPEETDLRNRCLELVDNAGTNPGDVGDALDALRQDVALGQSNAAYAAVGAQFDNLKTRIAALRSGSSGMDLGGLALATGSGMLPLSLLPADANEDAGGEIGSDFSRWGFFASGIIGRGSQDGDSVTPEYDFDTTGLTAGVDYRINDRVIVGASAGWNRQNTDLAQDRGKIDTRGWSVSAYSTWYRENAWYADGVLTLGKNDYDLERRIRYSVPGANGGVTNIDQRATASSGGDQTSLALSFGRDYQKGAWSLGPYLRGTYTRVEFDAYDEATLAGLPGAGLGLSVDSRTLESQTAVLGGKASFAMSRDWGILMPHLQLEWEHEFQDDPDQLVARFLHDPTGTPIATAGSALDTDYYNLGIGLSALFPGGKSAFLYYERLIGASGQSQDNLSLGVRIEF